MSDEFCPVRNARYADHTPETCAPCMKAERDVWRMEAERYKAVLRSIGGAAIQIHAVVTKLGLGPPPQTEPAPLPMEQTPDEGVLHYWGQGGVKCDAPLEDPMTRTTSKREAVTCEKCAANMGEA